MVLELTLKHVKALSSLLEQQQQKIIALQKDLQISKFDVVMSFGCKIEFYVFNQVFQKREQFGMRCMCQN